MHYKRQRRGAPLTMPTLGDPDGFGVYGDLDDDGSTVACHECGHRAASIGSHVAAVHGMTARAYKQAHGLPLSRGLISASERERLRAKVKATPGILRALDEHRDPAAAAASRTGESFVAVGVQARLDPDRARRNGDPGEILEACVVCGATWVHEPGYHRSQTCSETCRRTLTARQRRPRPGTAERDDQIAAAVHAGRSYAEVADEHGLTPERVGQIVRAHRVLTERMTEPRRNSPTST